MCAETSLRIVMLLFSPDFVDIPFINQTAAEAVQNLKTLKQIISTFIISKIKPYFSDGDQEFSSILYLRVNKVLIEKKT